MEIAIGVGSCSTLEAKYRWRNGERVCPQCGKPTIIKGKDEYGGGWLCWKKNGGCGTKWDNGAAAIEDQEVGKVENTNIADCYNTVLKMAKTRAFRDGMLMATATSGRFTQDLEDPHADEEGHYEEEDHGGGRARQEQPRQERKAAPAPNVRPQEFARAAQRQTEAKVTNMRGGALPVEDEAALSASGRNPTLRRKRRRPRRRSRRRRVVETAKALLAELEAFAKKRAFGETVEDPRRPHSRGVAASRKARRRRSSAISASSPARRCHRKASRLRPGMRRSSRTFGSTHRAGRTSRSASRERGSPSLPDLWLHWTTARATAGARGRSRPLLGVRRESQKRKKPQKPPTVLTPEQLAEVESFDRGSSECSARPSPQIRRTVGSARARARLPNESCSKAPSARLRPH